MLREAGIDFALEISPLFDPALPADTRSALVERIGRRSDYVEQQLAGKKFVFGDGFTVADAYLFTIVNWSGHVKIDLSRWPALKDYRKRVAERPKVQEALKAEGLIK